MKEEKNKYSPDERWFLKQFKNKLGKNGILERLLADFEQELEEIVDCNKSDDGSVEEELKKWQVVRYADALLDLGAYIDIKYSDYFKNKRDFPPKWVTRNNKIMLKAKNNKYLLPILKFLYWHQRRLRPKDVDQIFLLAESVVPGERYKEDHYFCVFEKDHEFTENIAKAVNCSTSMIDKYFRAFVKHGLILKLGRLDRYSGYVYSDGYLIKTPTGYRKQSFITERKHRKVMEGFSL